MPAVKSRLHRARVELRNELGQFFSKKPKKPGTKTK